MPFDWSQLAPLLGSLNPNSGGGFLRGWQRGQQERAARQEREQTMQLRTSAEQRAQSADQRATAADQRAAEDQELQRQQHTLTGVNSIRQLLEDPALDDPAEYDKRLMFAMHMAPQMGIEQGFVQSLRPPTDTFTKRKLTKLLDDFEKRPMSERQQAEQAIYWEVGGQRYTPAQARQALGRGGMDARTGQPFAFTTTEKQDAPNTPEEQFYATYAQERGTTWDALPTAEKSAARKMWMQSDDQPRATGAVTDAKRIATFNQIAGGYERSPLIRAADRTIVLEDAVKAIEANPRDPSTQLSLAYSFIQALDTYQSAVREGELGNLGMLGTRWQQFALQLNRIATEGGFLPPEVALNIAKSAKQLVQTIKSGQQRKQQEFASRARVSGVGDMWDSFVGGASAAPAASGPRPGGGTNPFRKDPNAPSR